MPDAAETNPPTGAPSDAQADAHLAKLHRMSTTAGVTNAGYVAVNHTAIAAGLLGLVSALAFFGWLLLIGVYWRAVRGVRLAISDWLSSGTA